jgi:hypothetical protein
MQLRSRAKAMGLALQSQESSRCGYCFKALIFISFWLLRSQVKSRSTWHHFGVVVLRSMSIQLVEDIFRLGMMCTQFYLHLNLRYGIKSVRSLRNPCNADCSVEEAKGKQCQATFAVRCGNFSDAAQGTMVAVYSGVVAASDMTSVWRGRGLGSARLAEALRLLSPHFAMTTRCASETFSLTP